MQGCIVKAVGSGDETVGGVVAMILMMIYEVDGCHYCDGDNPNDVGWFCESHH